MKPLAMEANRLAPFGTTYVWVPREQNKHADRLANEALDGLRSGVTVHLDEAEPGDDPDAPDSLVEEIQSPEQRAARQEEVAGYRGWSPPQGPVTTLVLVRHGATSHTADKRFSGGLASSNPGLTDEGRAQVREVADWLAPLGEAVETVVTSPVRRTRESAEILAERLGLDVVEEPGFAEMEFGTWDGLTFAEVRERYPTRSRAGSARSTSHRAGASRSTRSRSASWPASSASSTTTPARRSSWSATSLRSRCSWPRPSTHR
jgi:probable phosphoglycerate mutase